MSEPVERTRQRRLLKEHLWQPLLAQGRHLLTVVVTLVVLGAAQSGFLLLIKGFVTALFAAPGQDRINAAMLLPAGVVARLPAGLGELSLSRDAVAVAVPAAIALAGVVKALVTYVYQLHLQVISLGMARVWRDRLFAALLRLPYVEIRAKAAGEWMSLIMNDVLFLQMRFSDLVTALLRDGVVVLASMATLLVVHPPSGVVVLLLSPVVAIGMGRTGRRIARYAERFQRELARIAAMILDLRSRFAFIRAQSAESYERDRFQRLNAGYYAMIRRSIMVRSAFAPVLELVGFAVFAGFMWAISRQLLPGITADIMLQFFVVLGMLLKPLRGIGEQLSRLAETRGVLARSLATFARLDEIKESPRGGGPEARGPSRAGDRSGQACLRLAGLATGFGAGVSLRINDAEILPGRSIAVVGPSGAGKSTLIRTLAGLIVPSEWRGEPDWATFAAETSMVSQEPFLFDDTLWANLTYGLPATPDDAEVWRALAAVNVEAEARALPDGLRTRLRALGSNVSGGQLQRLVIARGLLRRRPVLLLDEATSAVDARSERDITLRLIESCRRDGLTLLAVTHRLTWLDAFDEVWFVENGRRLLAGPHGELLSTPRYRDFCAAGAH